MSIFLKLKKKALVFLGIIFCIFGFFLFPQILAKKPKEFSLAKENQDFVLKNLQRFLIIQENTLLPFFQKKFREEKITKRIKVLLTAYTSSPFETDQTPFITASGVLVRDGIVASNSLPFGTKIKIPEIFGEKIFVVEDRLNPKKGPFHIDIWFPERKAALNFGKKWTYIEIIE